MAPARKRKQPATRSGRKAILVIQFDSESLERDGLDLVPFAQAARLFAGEDTFTVVRATTLDDVHRSSPSSWARRSR